MTATATEPQKRPKTSSQEELQKIKEAEKKFQETITAHLKEINYTEVDDRRYAFIFNKKQFEFRTPTLLEKTKIKAILAEVRSFPGVMRGSGASMSIDASGDMDLICTTKVLTHTALLMNKPEGFNPDELSDGDQMDLGYSIWAAEYRFTENKKKVSTAAQ